MSILRQRSRTVGTIFLALALALSLLPGLAQPAHAAGQVTISGTPNADGATTVQVSGSGFQSVQGGFGGIYVLFGWVDDPSGGSWKPSNGGATGTNYRYVYDDETNPTGYQLFVTFPGSSTSAAANGGELSSDGTWSGSMIIPGAVFNTYDRQMNETSVDCRQVTCGIITIGAHGVTNANNESFTPITFSGGDASGATTEQQDTTDAAAGTQGTDTQAAESQAAEDQSAAQSATTDGASTTTENNTNAVTIPQEDNTMDDAVTGLTILGWLPILLPAVLLLGLSLVILAAGFGGYLAAKGLLLGVNPEALEKVRGQRERAAVRQREKQKRKTMLLERKYEIQTARASDRDAAMLARAEMKQTAARGGASPEGNNDDSVNHWLNFFQQQSTHSGSGGDGR